MKLKRIISMLLVLSMMFALTANLALAATATATISVGGNPGNTAGYDDELTAELDDNAISATWAWSDGETGATRTIDFDDLGKTLRATATYTPAGEPAETTATTQDVTVAAKPTISASDSSVETNESVTITVAENGMSEETLTWDVTEPTGATDITGTDDSTTLSFTPAVAGNYTVKAMWGSNSISTTVTVTAPAAATPTVTISGTESLHQTLTATPKDFKTITSYSWNGSNPTNTTATYVPFVADMGKTITVTVAGTDANDANQTATDTASISAPSIKVVENGDVYTDNTVSSADINDVVAVAWTNIPSSSYVSNTVIQWYDEDDNIISGATSQTFTITSSQEAVYAKVTWTGSGTDNTTYSLTTTEVNVDDGEAPYTITFSHNYKETNGTTTTFTQMTDVDGELSSMPSDPTRTNYEFEGWFTSTSGGTEIDTNYEFTDDTTVYARWDGDDLTVVDDHATVEVKANSSSSSGKTTATISASDFSNAIDMVEEEEDSNSDVDTTTVLVTLSTTDDEVEITLDKDDVLTKFKDSDVDYLTIETNFATVTIDKSLVQELLSNLDTNDDDIVLSMKELDYSDLTDDQQDEIDTFDEDVTVFFDFNLYIDGDTSDAITDFDGDDFVITVPYDFYSDIDLNSITAYYIDSNGELYELSTYYDEENELVSFYVDHFSSFFVYSEEEEDVITVPTTWQNPFYDVKTTDWFYDEVQFVHENGLFEGVSANSFSPLGVMNRGMVVTVLWRLAGQQTANIGYADFDDVPSGAYYEYPVDWATYRGIVTGIDSNTFAPSSNVTRQDLAVMLYRYAGSPAYSKPTLTFSDTSSISSYALTAMEWAVANGIITGNPDNTVRPKNTATRAEVAAIIMRFDAAY